MGHFTPPLFSSKKINEINTLHRLLWGENLRPKNAKFFNEINSLCGFFSLPSLLGQLRVPQHGHWRQEMQPPLIYRSVREQMEQLRDQARSPVKSNLSPSKRDQKIVDEYTSLIRSWQDQATPVQKLRLFTIDELIRLANLSGRFRVEASHRFTGEALRRCGFKQKRDWTTAGRNKRYWIWSTK